MRPREFKQRRNGILRVEANDLGAQFTRLLLGIDQATLCFGIDSERVLSQHRKFFRLEEVLQRPGYLFLAVDLAGAEALDEILDGQIQVYNLIGLLQKRVWDGFADHNVRRLLDQIIQTLQMLDVE